MSKKEISWGGDSEIRFVCVWEEKWDKLEVKKKSVQAQHVWETTNGSRENEM